MSLLLKLLKCIALARHSDSVVFWALPKLLYKKGFELDVNRT